VLWILAAFLMPSSIITRHEQSYTRPILA
jgi:hypothetical protein